MAADCLFCRIVRGEIPATLVAETEHCVAFRDIDPQAPMHVLVIPRAHVRIARRGRRRRARRQAGARSRPRSRAPRGSPRRGYRTV